MAFLTNSIPLDITITITTFIYLIYKYLTSTFDYWQNRGIQHIKPTSIFGNFKEVATVKTPLGLYLKNLYDQTRGDCFGIWVFRKPHLIIRSPNLIKHILVKDFNYFCDRTIVADVKADPLVSKMLFVLKNPAWKTMRIKFSPIFTSGKIKAMVPLINDGAEEMTNYLHALEGEVVEVKEVCAKFATDVITSCAFGVNAETFRHENAVFRDIGRKMFDFNISNAFRQTAYFFIPTIVKYLRITLFVPEANRFMKSTILETVRERENSGSRRNDLIDIIIDLKNAGIFDGLDNYDDWIVSQGLQFFAAGFEATSSAIAFTLYELCINPDMQKKLRNEILIAMNECEEEGISYETIKSIKYLDLVIQETLRKYPALPFLDRLCLNDYQIPGTDMVIEKGTPVYIPLLGLHYDPKYFPEPDKFVPERFTEEGKKTRPAYAHLPFGEGPHNCIGKRFGSIATKLGIIHILSKFVIEKCDETPVPIVFDTKSFVLQSTSGLSMKFIRYNTGNNNNLPN